MNFSKSGLETLYLSFVNDFITVTAFAEYYNLTEDQARSVIARGKIQFLSKDGNRSHFLNNTMLSNMAKQINNLSNLHYFMKNHERRLLNEHSA